MYIFPHRCLLRAFFPKLPLHALSARGRPFSEGLEFSVRRLLALACTKPKGVYTVRLYAAADQLRKRTTANPITLIFDLTHQEGPRAQEQHVVGLLRKTTECTHSFRLIKAQSPLCTMCNRTLRAEEPSSDQPFSGPRKTTESAMLSGPCAARRQSQCTPFD